MGLYRATGICRKCAYRDRCHEVRQHVIDSNASALDECPFHRRHQAQDMAEERPDAVREGTSLRPERA